MILNESTCVGVQIAWIRWHSSGRLERRSANEHAVAGVCTLDAVDLRHPGVVARLCSELVREPGDLAGELGRPGRVAVERLGDRRDRSALRIDAVAEHVDPGRNYAHYDDREHRERAEKP